MTGWNVRSAAGCVLLALTTVAWAAGATAPTSSASPAIAAGLADPVEEWSPSNSYATPMFDRATLVKQWRVAEYPGAEVARKVKVTANPRDFYGKPRGKRPEPVDAVRCSPGTPVFKLDLGTLEPGIYVVRVIAMVNTDDLQAYRLPLFVDCKINDKIGGGESYYRHRIPYWDSFYAVAEFYFNADEKRPYSATVAVGQGSQVDLYMHGLELHDCLAGLPGKAAKSKPGLYTYAERELIRKNANPKEVLKQVLAELPLDDYLLSQAPPLTGDARRDRDDLLWDAVPPINSQYLVEYDENFVIRGMRPGKMSVEECESQYGKWTLRNNMSLKAAWFTPMEFDNAKLNIKYTRQDIAEHKPLPESYPFREPLGEYFPKEAGMDRPQHWMPIGIMMGWWWEGARLPLASYHTEDHVHRLPYLYHALDDKRAARDAALMLVKWAYLYPSLTEDQQLGYAIVTPPAINRDDRLLYNRNGYQRPRNLLMGLLYSYDYLFDYIKDNQELAEAVSRYIPWVKTDEDVRRLIETRIVQYGARQLMRWQRWDDKGTPDYQMTVTAVQQDPTVTRPWMDFLFSRTWVYPMGQAGLQDFLSTTTQRDGSTEIGSVYYVLDFKASPFLSIVERDHRYVQNGGDPKFDLADLWLYGKVLGSCAFPLDCAVGGGFPLGIGNVGNPAKPRLLDVEDFGLNFRNGWNWTNQDRFAWLVKNRLGRTVETDEQWAAIEQAAARQGRDPYLASQSRVMANWAGILEAGADQDDFRLKRAAYIRVGTGHGHNHSDSLDLQILAHGCWMLNEVGWRPGYASPDSPATIVHNRVEVDGQEHPNKGNWDGHSWIDVFKPAPGAQYMHAVATPPGNHPGVKLYTREAALIDVDAGGQASSSVGSQPASRSAPAPANSYIFDVQRISGGVNPTFCFHGNWSDEFKVNLANQKDIGQNATDKSPKDTSSEGHYLRKFLDGPGLKYAGDAPSDGVVVATWRLRRAEEVVEGAEPNSDAAKLSLKQPNAEQKMMGNGYDPNAPRKFTKLHLFDRQGERILVGQIAPTSASGVPAKETASWPFLMVQKAAAGEMVYPAIIEPYAGQPFIQEAKLLEIPGNQTDALRAVAVQVKTVNGRTDLCYSDPRVTSRKVGDATVAAGFAYVSTDAEGPRMLHLADADAIQTPQVAAKLAARALQAGIVRVDYPSRKVYLDKPLGANPVGEQIELGNDQHKTSFTVVAAAEENGQPVVTVDKPIDISYVHVTACNPDKKEVVVNLMPGDPHPGNTAGLTCTSGDEVTKSWKCRVNVTNDKLGHYQLETPFTAQDFPVGGVMRVWEFGAGDTARLANHLYLARDNDAKGEYLVRANVDVTLSLPGMGTVEMKGADGKWTAIPGAAKGSTVEITLKAADLAGGEGRVRMRNAR